MFGPLAGLQRRLLLVDESLCRAFRFARISNRWSSSPTRFPAASLFPSHVTPPLLSPAECSALKQLSFGSRSLPQTNLLLLEELPALEEFRVGDAACASVSWLHLSLPQLTSFLVGRNAFTALKELTFTNLPVLQQFAAGDGSFAGATLIVLCRSPRSLSHRSAAAVRVIRGRTRRVPAYDASHPREWACGCGVTQRCRCCVASAAETGPS